MCMSRLQRVVAVAADGRVSTCDLDGREQSVSLLAYDGNPPQVDDWLIVQSGFALAAASNDDAQRARDELARAFELGER